MEAKSRTFVKLVYDNGGEFRALRGFLEGTSEDGLFFIIVRPAGQRILVSKAAVKTISPVKQEAMS
jgi:sRNA-binding regulator protein Hfq